MSSKNIFLSMINKRYFEKKNLYNIISIMYTLIHLDFASLYNFSYHFTMNKESEILIFDEKQHNSVFFQDDEQELVFDVLYSTESILYDKKLHVFTYTKGNIIEFEALNDLFGSDKNEILGGKIECNFNLRYFLKITKDVTAIPDKIDFEFVKGIIMVMKILKAVENKSWNLYFQALFFKTYRFYEKSSIGESEYKFHKHLNQNFWRQVGFDTKKNLTSALLNSLMIEHIFFEGNLILLESSQATYDKSLLDKHIPYKNLLLNNHKVLYTVENVLKDRTILSMFEVLFDEININSLILGNCHNFKILDDDFPFYVFAINSFKSITISNLKKCLSSLFLNKIKLVTEKNIEFLSLRNVLISKSDLSFICNTYILKGLVLNNVRTSEDFDFIEDYSDLNKTMEYINLKNVEIDYKWWNIYLETPIASKIILSLNTYFSQKNFIAKFKNINVLHCEEVLYLEIDFCYSEIFNHVCTKLFFFKSLQTLKLYGYKSNVNTESCLSEALKNMKALEFLYIKQYNFDYSCDSFVFEKQGIKILHFECFIFMKEFVMIDSSNIYKSLNKIVLKHTIIGESTLLIIFQLENLKFLSLKSCNFEPEIKSQSFHFNLKNLISLSFSKSNLKVFNNIDFLSNFDNLEKIDLSKCKVPCSYITKVSHFCDLRLKKFSYISGKLDLHDLNRMKNFQVLKILNLSKCKFVECNFSKLGDDCRFFNSMEDLNLLFVKINLEDLYYLRNFKKIRNLSFSSSNFSLVAEKSVLVLLPIKQFSTEIDYKDINYKNRYKYLYEKNINVDFI
ncbi:hypothetical protein CWI37_0413p0010 [Hamiltosporidium tvaerminnensis]|uniref:Uncharacterized protein n=1 Tax=Hamiltosporidium tvaerminnensis TaxID=1176355 RepID=A0A4Q9L699_9MICR|nr:hypothetical protein CWI37_0413p0010 [Hamiltosporidium tvaerminnensis]